MEMLNQFAIRNSFLGFAGFKQALHRMFGVAAKDSWASQPLQQMDPNEWKREPHHQFATLGAGCYWGTEKFFANDFEKKHPGAVVATSVGFMSADPNAEKNPTYKQVCSGSTSHIEVLHMLYDSKVVTYDDVIRHFFSIHDPTTVERQGNDRGYQYSSAIFYHSPEQKHVAENIIKQLDEKISTGRLAMFALFAGNRVVTLVEPATEFYPAHLDHQRYLEVNPRGYCNHMTRFKWEDL